MVSFIKSALTSIGLMLAAFQERAAAASVGNIGVCYDPMHNPAYPLNGANFDEISLRAAIDADFAVMANYVTNVRTFYAQYYGINITDYAAKYGLKIDLGVFMTSESWQNYEVDAAVVAIQKFPGTVAAVLVGNENLQNGITAAQILDIVTQIKNSAGTAATNIKFGTVQRITDYVTSASDAETAQLAAALDILGVNIYPFFSNSYDSNSPTALLDSQWKQMAAKFPANKMRLTETGFPTDGSPSVLSPSIQPSLSSSITYYNALAAWTPPSGNAAFPKFWFAMFDRRSDDFTFSVELEHHFGFLTYDRLIKNSSVNYPYTQAATCSTLPSGSCGSSKQGVKCCPVGAYCMPWSSSAYKCTSKPVKCSTQYTNTDFTGTTMSTWTRYTSANCCAKCASTTNCKGYSFYVTSTTSGTCYLMSNITGKKTRLATVSALLN